MTQLWELSATALSSALDRREASSLEVTRAHFARINALNGRLRAFSSLFEEQAERDARKSDDERGRGEVRGPLHGLPVSIKENFDFAGQPTTLGIPRWTARIAKRDAAMVTALRDAGAIVLGRTNLSQTLLFVESRNPVYGQTANPWSLRHTPGGSSGGEAAAVAAGMSPLGLGTDIGGSIRTPCHFSGIAGLKPTLDRLPAGGQRGILAGQEAVRSQSGPMARTVADLELFFRALDPRKLSALDARVPPFPLGDASAVKVKDLVVGVYTHDGLLTPSHAVARAVTTAADVLRSHRCKVIPFVPMNVPEMISLYVGAVSSDGAETMAAEMTRKELDVVLRPLLTMVSLPERARSVLARSLDVVGEKSSAMMLRAIGEKSVADYWRLTDRLRAYRQELVRQMDDAGVDVLLCPAYATPAFAHTMSKNFSLASSYAMLFNLVQFPAGVVPVTRVKAEEAYRDGAREMLEKHAARIDRESATLPVGVQVVARPWAEDVVLATMRALESALASRDDFPATPVSPAGGA